MSTVYSLIIHFSFFVGGQSLHLSTAQYKNGFGEPFTINQCKYYVSAIRVEGPNGDTQTVLEHAHLVDAADSGTLTLHLTTSIPAITKIRFIIGVDNSANTGGVQTGDLDPMLGMFWTWNTGYIYARLEGISDSARAPAHRFTWDIGGYRPGVNATREVVLSVPSSTSRPGSLAPRLLDIHTDLLRWFDGHHSIHLSQSPVCHQPGALAMQLADNYGTMFSIAP